MDNHDLVTDVRKKRRREIGNDNVESSDDDMDADERAMSNAVQVTSFPASSSASVETIVRCDNVMCGWIFLDPTAKFCRKCKTEKNRKIICEGCRKPNIFSADLLWCDHCGLDFAQEPVGRVSDEGLCDVMSSGRK